MKFVPALKERIRRVREKKYNLAYEKNLSAARGSYESCRLLQEKEALALAQRALPKDVELLVSPEGELSAGAVASIGAYMAAHPEVLVLYGDEDVADADGTFHSPWLKPDWSPDTFLDHDYIGSVLAVRTALLEQASVGADKKELLTLAGGFAKGQERIAHLPRVLFHRNTDWQQAASAHAKPASVDLSGHFCSIIIPSKDHFDILSRCLDSLAPTIQAIPYEVIVVDNGSEAKTKADIEKKLASLSVPTRYLYEAEVFNFSRMCNKGAAAAKGDLLLFLNDDIEAIAPGWLEIMAAKALAPYAGAVGAKLFYPGTNKIQHAGITNIKLGPMHKLQYLEDDGAYYDDYNNGIRNMIAVTGACMLMRAEVFKEVGGFAPILRIAFNDVDLCYSLHDAGYYNIQCNNLCLYHHESLSRGKETTKEEQQRLMGERDTLYARHPHLEGVDPFYHAALNCRMLDTKIYPAYEEGDWTLDVRKPYAFALPKEARQDPCLAMCIEGYHAKHLQGWIVVLGSNNACFSTALLLESLTEPGQLLRVDFTPQYRVDLERNLPDQKNVAFSGFHMDFAGRLPAGEYRIGAMARDLCSSLCLVNWVAQTLLVNEETPV